MAAPAPSDTVPTIRVQGRSSDMTAVGTPASKSARAVNAGGRYQASEMEEDRIGNDAALFTDSFRFVARGVLLAPMIGKNETDRASSGRRRLVI